VFLPEIAELKRGVHIEIPNIKKLCEALPTQVFKVVAKSSERAKSWQRAHIVCRPDQPQMAH